MVNRAWFLEQAQAYERAAAGSAFPLDWSALHPCDDREGGAIFDAHYIHADLALAQWIAEAGSAAPHVDVGSRVDGLVTHLLAAGHEVTHVDVRDPHFEWPHFYFRQDDARTLSTFPSASVKSLSTSHAIEHCGLSRYGDELDHNGMFKAMAALARVLAPGGKLYLAVPVGKMKVCFNAHRVVSPSWVISTFAAHGLTLESFAAVDDAGAWHPEARPEDYEGASYACGMFLMTKGGW